MPPLNVFLLRPEYVVVVVLQVLDIHQVHDKTNGLTAHHVDEAGIPFEVS